MTTTSAIENSAIHLLGLDCEHVILLVKIKVHTPYTSAVHTATTSGTSFFCFERMHNIKNEDHLFLLWLNQIKFGISKIDVTPNKQMCTEQCWVMPDLFILPIYTSSNAPWRNGNSVGVFFFVM